MTPRCSGGGAFRPLIEAELALHSGPAAAAELRGRGRRESLVYGRGRNPFEVDAVLAAMRPQTEHPTGLDWRRWAGATMTTGSRGRSRDAAFGDLARSSSPGERTAIARCFTRPPRGPYRRLAWLAPDAMAAGLCRRTPLGYRVLVAEIARAGSACNRKLPTGTSSPAARISRNRRGAHGADRRRASEGSNRSHRGGKPGACWPPRCACPSRTSCAPAGPRVGGGT